MTFFGQVMQLRNGLHRFAPRHSPTRSAGTVPERGARPIRAGAALLEARSFAHAPPQDPRRLKAYGVRLAPERWSPRRPSCRGLAFGDRFLGSSALPGTESVRTDARSRTVRRNSSSSLIVGW